MHAANINISTADLEQLAEGVAASLPLGLISKTIASSALTVLWSRKMLDDVLNTRGSLSREIGNNAAQTVAFALTGESPDAEGADDARAWADVLHALERAGVPACDHEDKPMTAAERVLWLMRQRPVTSTRSITLTGEELRARQQLLDEHRERQERLPESEQDHPQYDTREEKEMD